MAKSSSIVDRTTGWGHEEGSDTVRNDAGSETTTPDESVDTATAVANAASGGRWDRQKVARKTFKEDNDPAIVERTRGLGGTVDTTLGADAGYVADKWEDADVVTIDAAFVADYDNGVFYDDAGDAETGVGSDTKVANNTTATHATGRTRDTRDTVGLDDGNATQLAESERTSIRDRSDGWGHADGTFANRND